MDATGERSARSWPVVNANYDPSSAGIAQPASSSKSTVTESDYDDEMCPHTATFLANAISDAVSSEFVKMLIQPICLNQLNTAAPQSFLLLLGCVDNFNKLSSSGGDSHVAAVALVSAFNDFCLTMLRFNTYILYEWLSSVSLRSNIDAYPEVIDVQSLANALLTCFQILISAREFFPTSHIASSQPSLPSRSESDLRMIIADVGRATPDNEPSPCSGDQSDFFIRSATDLRAQVSSLRRDVKSLASVSCTQSSLIDDAQRAISRCRADTSRCVAHVSEVIMPILKKIPPELDAAGARAFRTDLDVLSDRVADLALRFEETLMKFNSVDAACALNASKLDHLLLEFGALQVAQQSLSTRVDALEVFCAAGGSSLDGSGRPGMDDDEDSDAGGGRF